MKVLVTGGLGFIGHNVVRDLERQRHQVVIADTCTNYGIIPQDELDYLISERRKKIFTNNIHKIDVADEIGIDWLMAKHQPDTVIHLASFPRQKVVNANPTWGSRTMIEGLLNLLEAGVKYKIKKFVYISSSMVYGDFKDTYFDGVDENHTCRPIGQYGIMKLAGEWLVHDYWRRSGLTYTIIRPSAVYGPLDVEDRVVSKFLLGAMRNETIKVNGESESLDFTYVDEIARGIADAAMSTNTDNMTYNVTRGQARSLLDAAKIAVDIVGHGQIQVNTRDKNFPTRGQLNIVRAQNDFAYYPAIDIEQGFQQYYDWLANSVYWSKKTV